LNIEIKETSKVRSKVQKGSCQHFSIKSTQTH